MIRWRIDINVVIVCLFELVSNPIEPLQMLCAHDDCSVLGEALVIPKSYHGIFGMRCALLRFVVVSFFAEIVCLFNVNWTIL